MRAALCTIALLLACAPPPRAEVWFTSAPHVPTNTPVVIDEQLIGTTGEARVIAGALRVTLHLTNPDCVPDETVFVIEHQAGALRLRAHPRGNPIDRTTDRPLQFRGAATRAEYWLLLAREHLLP